MIYNNVEYPLIKKFDLKELNSLPTAVTQLPLPPSPYLMCMVQNEDQIDFWVLDPSDRVGAMEQIRQYYREEEPWVINHPRFEMRVFTLSPEIVY